MNLIFILLILYTYLAYHVSGTNILSNDQEKTRRFYPPLAGGFTNFGFTGLPWVPSPYFPPINPIMGNPFSQWTQSALGKITNHVPMFNALSRVDDCGTQAREHQQNLFPTTNFPWLTRLIGGSEARKHSWPWHVLFQRVAQPGDFVCGATLIRVMPNIEASDILVTAAHCVTYNESNVAVYYNPDDFEAYAAVHNVDDVAEERETRKPIGFFKHKHYDMASMQNDIALVKLESPIPFGNTIRPICRPQQGEPVPFGMKCAVTGFGRIHSDDDEASHVLKQEKVDVHMSSTCTNNVVGGWGDFFAPNIMICAGQIQWEPTESTCQGDSGGPLQCLVGGKWTLYGVISFGGDNTCLIPGKPSIFARVSSFAEWIHTHAFRLSQFGLNMDQ